LATQNQRRRTYETLASSVLPNSPPHSPPQPELSIRNGSSSDKSQKSSQPEHSNRNGGSLDENQMSSQVHSLTVEEYRIAGPIYLPIPVRSDGLVGQRYRDAWEASLKSDVHQILHISISCQSREAHNGTC